jgi:malate dehydrogenase (oxaloacetate-decarboxylating)
VKLGLARRTNAGAARGDIAAALEGADVLIGVSGGTIDGSAIARMAADPIVFALANPIPEVLPEVAHAAGARVVATGRSDFPNQINNVLAFPGIFRGALDVGATRITEGMKRAAAGAIADLVGDELAPDCIVPDPFHPQLASSVAEAVKRAAVRDGVIR